jgi:glycosyltransferase involved in cell wall biosynthesis
MVASREIAEALEECVDQERLSVIPAFLDPVQADPAGRPLDEEAERFLTEAAPALVASAYRVSPTPEGDLYGLDVAVEIFLRIAEEIPTVRLALFLALEPRGRRECNFLDSLMQRVTEAGKRGRLLIRIGAPLLPALRSNSIFLRPTRSDGDAVSVREALAYGVPVIATDAVERPTGTRVCPVGDVDAMVEEVQRIVTNGGESSPRTPSAARTFESTLISLYERQLTMSDGIGSHVHSRAAIGGR